MSAIERASRGAILFVGNPDEADVLIFARQYFQYYGNFYINGNKGVIRGYSCKVTLRAAMLSNSIPTYSVTRTRNPGNSISVTPVDGQFAMKTPDFDNTNELGDLVNAIMGWYGYDSRPGETSQGICVARQSLIDRGYLDAEPSFAFDAEMENAVKQMQKDYGLEETGVIDRATLVALYYDTEVVEEMLQRYPLSLDD